MEIAPGIHRIEGDLGERYVCQYLVVGDERSLLVDTGLRDMPRTVIAPFLDGRRVDYALISHADVDHSGGNRALRELSPDTRLLCGEADRAWIESNAAMLAENYRWYEAYGFGPSADDVAFLDRALEFVREVRAAVRAAAPTDLAELTWAVDAQVGPFPSFTHELAASVRAHLAMV